MENKHEGQNASAKVFANKNMLMESKANKKNI